MIDESEVTLFEKMDALGKPDADAEALDASDSLEGEGPNHAIKVSSVSDEYVIMAIGRLKPVQQRLVKIDGRSYDVFTTEGHTTEIWFDVTETVG